MLIKKFPRQVLLLSFVSFFTDIASEMLYPVTPIFLTAVLGSSMTVVGIIEGIAEITAGFLKGYFGNLSDKLGKRAVFVVLGYGISAISKPVPGLIASVPAVVVSRTADRVGKGIRTSPRDALLGSYSNGKTGATFGFHRAMDTLGAAIGPLIAIYLLYLFPGDFKLIFLIAFVPSVIAVFFAFLVKDKPIQKENKSRANYSVFWKEVSREYKLVLIMITLFSFVNSSDAFLILKSRFISDSNTIAILGYVFFNIIYAAFSFPLGHLSDKYGKKNIFCSGLVVFSLVYLGFALIAEMIFIWFLFALYGIYSAATEGVSKAWITDLVSEEWRGSAIGLLTMSSSFAIMLGSLAAGVLWDYFGASVPFLVSSIASFLIAIILFIRADS